MGGGEERIKNREVAALLAGLEAGVLATLALLGWLALAAAGNRRSIWSAANLMATTFYGDSAFNRNFSARTLSGLALYLTMYGVIGALFGLTLAGRPAGLRTTLIGTAVGLGWYYLSFSILWRNVNPLIPLYTHPAPDVFGHALFGALLGRFPHYLAQTPSEGHDRPQIA